ncbi:hypothetical protein ID866_8402 [Astraeus odoratus]|nr:hypothetical protein ID866_8402 [Astraeus odoratus]
MRINQLPTKAVPSSRQKIAQGYSRPGTPNTNFLQSKDPWLKAAHESTEHFKLHGSPVPLVWVLTEDSNIPPNAVPFSEDANGNPLYIARIRLEVHALVNSVSIMHLGKTGRGFNGAVVSYAGKEHLVSKYEVLVCASLLRWGFPSLETNNVLQQGTVVLAQQHRHEHMACSNVYTDCFSTSLRSSDIPRYVLHDQGDTALKRLGEIKAVILVDDSISMTEGNLWQQARGALGGIVDIANRYGSTGIDLHFMHDVEFAEQILSADDVAKVFANREPDGLDTPTGAKLAQLIDQYLPLIEHKECTHQPISILVITDGAATDYDDLVQAIVDAAHRLDRAGVREDMFGIQFVQIGTDEDAAQALRALDDELEGKYRIRDIVDTTPFNPAQGATFDTEYMLKILLGSIRKDLDKIPNTNVASPLTQTLGRKTSMGRMNSSGLTPRSLPLKSLPPLR